MKKKQIKDHYFGLLIMSRSIKHLRSPISFHIHNIRVLIIIDIYLWNPLFEFKVFIVLLKVHMPCFYVKFMVLT